MNRGRGVRIRDGRRAVVVQRLEGPRVERVLPIQACCVVALLVVQHSTTVQREQPDPEHPQRRRAFPGAKIRTLSYIKHSNNTELHINH